ncbi:hypothetical protein PM8797T_28409 [Gimesia maris DSM 8797]|nr:hypothetical protein PM8797T_28409 [Gimesia maris DSM 8797]
MFFQEASTPGYEPLTINPFLDLVMSNTVNQHLV